MSESRLDSKKGEEVEGDVANPDERRIALGLEERLETADKVKSSNPWLRAS